MGVCRRGEGFFGFQVGGLQGQKTMGGGIAIQMPCRYNIVFVAAGVAQLVEHLICNQRVGGSNPFASSKLSRGRR